MTISWRRLTGRSGRFDPRKAGLRVLNGRSPEPWPASMAGRVLLAVADIDHDSGVAAVWLVHRTPARTMVGHLDRYEIRGNAWHYLGGGGSVHSLGQGEHFPADRVSASILGHAHLLQQAGNCSGRAPRPHDWVGCTALRVASEVARIRVGHREVPVPDHGYLIVVWTGSPARVSRGRPRIVALDGEGNALTELGSGNYLDSATLAAINDDD